MHIGVTLEANKEAPSMAREVEMGRIIGNVWASEPWSAAIVISSMVLLSLVLQAVLGPSLYALMASAGLNAIKYFMLLAAL